VVTGAETGTFPANLPVGTVHYTSSHIPEVEPAALLDRLEIVRIFDYGLNGIMARKPRSRRRTGTTDGERR